MALKMSKLKNVHVGDEKHVAQCPACHEKGEDSKGNHLAVFPPDAFHCIKYPHDRMHNARILELAGDGLEEGAKMATLPKVVVRPYVPPAKRVLLEWGREGHLFSILDPKEK